MDPNAVQAGTRPGQSSIGAEQPGDSGMLDDIHSLWDELHGLSRDRFQLAALEARRAGLSLVIMLVTGVMLALLLSAAWLGLLAASVQWQVENGFKASSAILLAVAFNLLLALILCGVIRRRSRYLQFPAMLRSLERTPAKCRNSKSR